MMVSQIYPSELQLNKANTSDTEAAFLDLHLSISNDITSTKIYFKRGDSDFEIVNMAMFLALHPIEFIFLNSCDLLAHHVADLNTRNKLLTRRLLKAISSISFAKLFLIFIADTMI